MYFLCLTFFKNILNVIEICSPEKNLISFQLYFLFCFVIMTDQNNEQIWNYKAVLELEDYRSALELEACVSVLSSALACKL